MHPPQASPKPKKPGGIFLFRLMLVAFGLYMAAHGWADVQRHVFSYRSWRGYDVFPAGLVAMGLFIILLAFLPNGDWFYRRITTKRTSLDEQLRQAHLKHPARHRHNHSVATAAEPETPKDC